MIGADEMMIGQLTHHLFVAEGRGIENHDAQTAVSLTGYCRSELLIIILGGGEPFVAGQLPTGIEHRLTADKDILRLF